MPLAQALSLQENLISHHDSYLQIEDHPIQLSLQTKLLRIAKVSAWNAIGMGVGTFGWMVGFYSTKNSIAKCFLEGTFSNLPTLYFSYRASLANGEAKDRALEEMDEDAANQYAKSEARKDMLRDVFIYYPIDTLYQVIQASIIMLSKKNNTAFDLDAEPEFVVEEVLLAMAFYIGGVGLLFFMLNRLVRSTHSIGDALKVGIEYFIFYLTDIVFVDWGSLLKILGDILGSSAIVTGACLILETLPNALHTWHEHKVDQQHALMPSSSDEKEASIPANTPGYFSFWKPKTQKFAPLEKKQQADMTLFQLPNHSQ